MCETASYSLSDLQARDEPLVPNRILGSLVSIEGGTVDVVVPPERAVACLGTELSAKPEADWARLHDQAEHEGDEYTSGYARRRGLEIRFIRLALGQVAGAGDAAEPVDNSVAIAEIQERLYDHYDPDLYRSALKEKIDIIAGLDVAPDLAESKALLLDELDAYLGAEPVRPLERPDGQTLTAVRDWIDDQFGDLFAAIDADGIAQYDADGIARMFRLAIDTTPALRNTGWEPVVLNKEKNVISVAVGKTRL